MATHEVIVGNIGTVYRGEDETRADSFYAEYVNRSITNYGRSGGETVTMLKDGELVKEHTPPTVLHIPAQSDGYTLAQSCDCPECSSIITLIGKGWGDSVACLECGESFLIQP